MNEAELLFTQVLNCERASLYLNKDLTLDKRQRAFVASALKRRMQSEPLQYILGKTEFMGLEFLVDENVFIPRPETEVLVETVMERVTKSQSHKVTSINILDIGTGSGCIAISLAKLLPDNIKITATDISERALILARQNAQLNGVKVNFIQSDLFNAYSLQLTAYSLIVSNPPYIATSEIDNLQPEIQYEPRLALDGGREGLDFYRRLISQAPYYLKAAGLLILEIGFNQRQAIENIFQKSGNFEIIEVVKDYNDIDRVIVARMTNYQIPIPKQIPMYTMTKRYARKWIN